MLRHFTELDALAKRLAPGEARDRVEARALTAQKLYEESVERQEQEEQLEREQDCA